MTQAIFIATLRCVGLTREKCAVRAQTGTSQQRRRWCRPAGHRPDPRDICALRYPRSAKNCWQACSGLVVPVPTTLPNAVAVLAEQVMALLRCLHGMLKLMVNQSRRAVASLFGLKFSGFNP